VTLVSDIITQGYRESNIIAITVQPTPTQVTEALARLDNLVLSALGDDIGYLMEDWNIQSTTSIKKPSGIPLTTAHSASFTVPPNARLVCNLTAPMVVALDGQPQDGQRFAVVDARNTFVASALTVNPNGRKFDGEVGPAILNEAGLNAQWFYRSDIADWLRLAPLTADGQLPFPPEFDDYFVTMLAMRLNPRYGMTLNEQSTGRLAQQKTQIMRRYSQTRIGGASAPTEG
jgi:hypothetical protein